MKPTAQLLALIEAGAHLDLSQGSKTKADLLQLAGAAAARGVDIIIPGTRPVADLIDVVKAGEGRVRIAWPSKE